MSLVQCGICGAQIGLGLRCKHQPAPISVPDIQSQDNDEFDQLLLDATEPVEDIVFDDEDFDRLIPRSIPLIKLIEEQIHRQL